MACVVRNGWRCTLDDLTVETRIIEQGAEQILQVADGVGELAQLRFELGRRAFLQESCDEQTKCLGRLAQIMAGRGEEAAARARRLLGRIALMAQQCGRFENALGELFLGLPHRRRHFVDALRQPAELVISSHLDTLRELATLDAGDDRADLRQGADQAAGKSDRQTDCQ